MFDFNSIPQHTIVERFIGPKGVDTSYVWQRPRGVTMAHIFCVSFGGSGGSGGQSAPANTAGGGGGGGSSGQSTLIIPLALLPERLHIHHSNTANASGVGLDPAPTLQGNSTLIRANAGGNGTSGSASAGAAGGAGAIATIAQMALAGLGFYQLLVGQAGSAGASNASAASSVAIPTTGLCVTAGTGGGGHSTGNGGNAGAITAAGIYPGVPAGTGSNVSTVPANDGGHGFNMGGSVVELFSGGTGGGACDASATGAGLYAGKGGNGFFGSGGGGGGAGITGAGGGQGGLGGTGLIIITAW